MWATGGKYKASFHDGMTFVPYLGDEYPQTVNWSWRTEAVLAGGEPLALRDAAPRWTDWRVEYDLGAVVEAYDVRVEGLEQTFVLRQRPPAGDLVVRGRVASDLQPVGLGGGHQELWFADDAGRPLVGYGAATAVDARGDRQPMQTTFVDGRLELRIDGAWLAEAAYPVVLDPLLTPTTMVVGSEVTSVDLVHETISASDQLWVAYSRAVSATDSDLYVRRGEASGLNHYLVYQDVTANWSSFEASITYVRGADCVVAAFTREFANGDRSVRFHRHDRPDTSSSTSYVAVTTPVGAHLGRPAIGGSRVSNAGTQALLVMQRDNTPGAFYDTTSSKVYASVLDLSGTGSAGPVFTIGDQVGSEFEHPAVNRLHTDANGPAYWLVACQAANSFVGSTNTTWDVQVRRVGSDGSVSAPMTIANGDTDQRHEFSPRIAGGRGRYVVAMVASTVGQQPVRPGGQNGHSVRTRIVHWEANAPTGSQPYELETINANTDARVELVGLAQDLDSHTHWGLAYRSNVTQSVYFATLGYTGNPIETATAHSGSAAEPTLAGGMAYDALNDNHLIGYAVNGAGASAGAVTLGRFELSSLPSLTQSGIGCSSVVVGWNGSHRIGSGYGAVTMYGAPAGSLMTVMLAFQTTAQPLIGVPGIENGCWLLVPNTGAGHLGVLPIQFGPAGSWNLPLPEWLPPTTLYAQGFHSDAALNLFSSTQRVTLPFQR
ncbi:MAG: hypothetical protein IT456_28495 [Planctomycetes bacterium]|nr:hypothetical protein [Planctomycetota bacterium]